MQDNNIPYFEEAKTVLFCKNMFAQDMEPECIKDKDIIKKWYPDNDFHALYIAEITKIKGKI